MDRRMVDRLTLGMDGNECVIACGNGRGFKSHYLHHFGNETIS